MAGTAINNVVLHNVFVYMFFYYVKNYIYIRANNELFYFRYCDDNHLALHNNTYFG